MIKNNHQGEERRIGFEIEYAGLPLDQVSEIVTKHFGGNVNKSSRMVYEVEDTLVGDFKLELDSIPLQEIAKQNKALSNSEELVELARYQLGKTANDVGEMFVPYEIVCPPIKLSDIPKLQTMCDELREAGAKGTKSSWLYAFGLHLNPEVASVEPAYVLKHIQVFLLLSGWLEKVHQVDISRRMTSFIDPFPESYYELLLSGQYEADLEKLIRDYHAHNPTRNRALDMLPLFAYLEESLVLDLYGTEEKINKRPTFHYRLPNCEIGQQNWTLEKEWARWKTVEAIAQNDEWLSTLLQKWQSQQARWFTTSSSWVDEVDAWMESEGV